MDTVGLEIDVHPYLGEDSLPKIYAEEENVIHRILNSNGVNYTHHNENILKASTIETKLTKKAIEVMCSYIKAMPNKTNVDTSMSIYRAKGNGKMRARES